MLNIVNPYTKDIVGSVKSCSIQDVDIAINKLKSYKFDLSAFERSLILNKAVELLKKEQDIFVDLITSEIGVSKKDAMHEVERSFNVISLCAEEAKRIPGEVTPAEVSHGFEDRLIYSIREPIGIVLCITPFNHPLNQVIHKIGPAIAAGNAILLKPSKKSPLTALKIVELLYKAGIPENMLQIITGEDSVLGENLVSRPEVNMISFTGSVRAGEIISSMCGIKKISLELGGNDAMVIDETADLNLAVKLACEGAFKNSGQRCSSVKRLILLPSIKDEFIDKLIVKVEAIVTGDPNDSKTDIGTVIDEESAIIIEKRMKDAISDGAVLLSGGSRNGAQIIPAIIDKVTMSMELVKDETFGPVMPILECQNIDDAIRIVNDTKFGLNASLISNNHSNINKFIKSVVVGGVRINAASSFRNEMLPFGGINKSGYGRGGIIYAIKEMTNLKTILI
jgi:aldehyde dehydrogenase (NAD+)